VLAPLAVAACLAIAALPARADDAATSFSPTVNPTGRWSYGWTPALGGSFAAFATRGTDANGIDYWRHAANLAQVSHNGTNFGKTVGSTYTPSGGLNLQPGTGGQFAVVRWTATTAGSYSIHARLFSRVLANSYMTAEISVLLDGAVLFDRYITAQGPGPGALDGTFALAAGQSIDFVVGDAHDGSAPDVVGLDATVNGELAPSPAGPVFAFGGERFVGCRWPGAFESMAFDPLNRRLASHGKLRGLCGNVIGDGPDDSPGLCWDQRTATYWQLTTNRVVRRWSAAGALLDTVFTIPLVFTVPGVGSDTLPSPRGIATDSNYVYVVDAGAAPGAIGSNEWLKFTRAGVPVKSSKTTDFTSHLVLEPDATADDIIYVPFGAAPYAGRLVVPIEHTGFVVLDTEGMFVDELRWSLAGFVSRPVSAFAGLAVDAATGNFYFADNDPAAALMLSKLPGPQAASYAVATVGGSGGAGLQLKYPTAGPGCDLPVWKSYGLLAGSSGNLFGLGFRPADRFVYSVDFSTGDLWRADPLLGPAQRVGSTGTSSVWGLTYDTQRDVFYLIDGNGPVTHILVLDPVTLAVHPLPQAVGYELGGSTDLAFDPLDGKLYAPDRSVVPSRLVRIDRDSGAGVVVGNLGAPVVGLDFDPVSGQLLGITTSAVYRVDPASGGATLLSNTVGGGFEGLAVVAVPVNPTVLAVNEPPAPSASARLVTFPNPARDGATIGFALPVATAVRVGVYDVAGRLVREVGEATFTAGAHRLAWDGRDAQGVGVASGVYFVRVESAKHTTVGRLVIVK
jgi:hypothetical protein